MAAITIVGGCTACLATSPFGDFNTSDARIFSVSGTVQGLDDGQTVTLQLTADSDAGAHGQASQRVPNGPFTFAAAVDRNEHVVVSVAPDPGQDTCSVGNGDVYESGGTDAGNLAGVSVTCASGVATLSDLRVSNGVLAFDPTKTTFAVQGSSAELVNGSTTAMTATATSPSALVTVGVVTLPRDVSVPGISFEPKTPLTVTVTPPNGIAGSYSLTFDPTFRSQTDRAYAAAVGATAVSADGAWGVSGTPDDFASKGAVYIFRQASTSGNQAIKLAGLPQPNAQDRLGAAVTLSADGSTLAVGAPGASTVYVLTRQGDTWTLKETLSPANAFCGATAPATSFGRALALSADGTSLAVGEPDQGLVCVFMQTAGMWDAHGVAVAEAPVLGLGTSVALGSDGTTLVSGAAATDADGSVLVFTRASSTAAIWSKQATLGLANASPADAHPAGAHFGASVALLGTGDLLVVGADRHTNAATSALGSVSVFERVGSTWTGSLLPAPFAAGSAQVSANGHFGAVVAVATATAGPVIAIGMPGDAVNAAGVNGGSLGSSMLESGAVYLYRKGSAGGWAQQDHVKEDTPVAHAAFGQSLAMSQTGVLFAGALGPGAAADTAGRGVLHEY